MQKVNRVQIYNKYFQFEKIAIFARVCIVEKCLKTA